MKIVKKICLSASVISLAIASAGAQGVQDYINNPYTRKPLQHLDSWVGTGSEWNYTQAVPGVQGKFTDNSVVDMYVTADGTVYYNSGYDEDGHECGVISSEGKWIGRLSNWGLRGSAITVDEQLNQVFVSDDWNQTRGGENLNHTSFPPVSDTWVHKIPVGHVNDPGGGTPNNAYFGFRVDNLSNAYDQHSAISGLATNGNELYVSDQFNGKIRVYDLNTWPTSVTKPMASPTLLREFSFTKPKNITIDKPSGNLWVVLNDPKQNFIQKDLYPFSATVVLVDKNTGAILKTISDVKCPNDIQYNSIENTLWVCEGGRDSQIRIYKNLSTTPVLDRTFGDKFGILSGVAGEVKPMKLGFPTGIGFDALGNVYVAQCNGKSGWGPLWLESYTPAGALRWRVENIGVIETAILDQANEDTYTSHGRLSMDFTKTKYGAEYTWKGFTLNTYKYLQDSRNDQFRQFHNPLRIVNVDGHKFQYNINTGASYVSYYRFNKATDGETAIPCGVFDNYDGNPANAKYNSNYPSPNIPASWVGDKQLDYTWYDKNADGNFQVAELEEEPLRRGLDNSVLCVDSLGDIWTYSGQYGLKRYLMGGLARLKGGPRVDANGVPIYHANETVSYTLPNNDFTVVKRIEYDLNKDELYISGDNPDNVDNTNESYAQGGLLLKKYKNVSSGNPTLVYSIRFAKFQELQDGPRGPGNLSIAGDYIFAAHRKGLELTHIFKKSTGEYVGELSPAAQFNKNCFDDQALGMRAYRRSNGEYLVFYQRSFGPSMMFRWVPEGTVLAIENESNSSASSAISIFPNPAKTSIKVLDKNAEMKAGNISVYDIYGRLHSVTSKDLGLGQVQIDVESLAKGTYILKTVVSGITTTNRFTVE